MPSSFARDHSRALVFSTRLPVSVYGTVTSSSPSRGFSWQHGLGGFVPRRDRDRASALNGATDLPAAPAYTLQPTLPIVGPLILLRHPNVQTTTRWYRNIDLFPIDYAFRPRLRDRLTLGGLTFPRKPWTFGQRGSHTLYRYLCRQSLFRALQPFLRSTFNAHRMLPYHVRYPGGFRTFAASVLSLSPVELSAPNRLTSELLRFL